MRNKQIHVGLHDNVLAVMDRNIAALEIIPPSDSKPNGIRSGRAEYARRLLHEALGFPEQYNGEELGEGAKAKVSNPKLKSKRRITKPTAPATSTGRPSCPATSDQPRRNAAKFTDHVASLPPSPHDLPVQQLISDDLCTAYTVDPNLLLYTVAERLKGEAKGVPWQDVVDHMTMLGFPMGKGAARLRYQRYCKALAKESEAAARTKAKNERIAAINRERESLARMKAEA